MLCRGLQYGFTFWRQASGVGQQKSVKLRCCKLSSSRLPRVKPTVAFFVCKHGKSCAWLHFLNVSLETRKLIGESSNQFVSVIFECSRKISGMVEITTRVEASFLGGKAVALPDHLLVEHDGCRFLKVRSTSPAICKLLSPNAPSKNPSFTSSPALADLLKKGMRQLWWKTKRRKRRSKGRELAAQIYCPNRLRWHSNHMFGVRPATYAI